MLVHCLISDVSRLNYANTCRGFIFLGLLFCAGCGEGANIISGEGVSSFREELPVTFETATESASNVGSSEAPASKVSHFVPDWAAEAVFYQIFPERFRNGDPTNDPTRESLEDYETVPDSWKISPWTGDWYERADWEQEIGDDFYNAGVFHRRYGGDLQGIIDKLDYLQELGINAIYLNPVFYGRSLHKYDAASMHHIDPYFGPDPEGDLALMEQETHEPATWQWTAADKLFLELVDELHQRGIKVIIDGVFNHTGRDFFAFADLQERQEQSPYKNWYIVERFDNPETPENEFRYKSWWGFHTLPEFANSQSHDDLHPGPKEYVFDITRRWMDPDGNGDPSDGIDGWRLDVANEVPMGFWQDWHQLVRNLNPEAYTVGEFWGDAQEQLIQGHFSATMNYHGFAYPVKGYLIDGTLQPSEFGRLLQVRLRQYPPPMRYALQNLIDSHDTDRVASMIVNSEEKEYSQPERFDYDVSERVSPRHSEQYSVRKPNQQERRVQRLVALMQMTFVGPPMVYYGTESGMWGADDPCNRMPMVWDDLKFEAQSHDPRGRERQPDQVQFDQRLYDFYRRVIHLRRNMPVLHHGSFVPVESDDEAQFFAFRRQGENGSVLVAINRGAKPFTWELSSNETKGVSVLESASGSPEFVEIEELPDKIRVTLPGVEAVVSKQVRAE